MIIKQRRGTAAEWVSANPILSAGEEGFETDTGKFKIGNGFSNWSALDYFIPKNAIDSAIGIAKSAAQQRSNHVGEQTISTITGLQTALDAKLEALTPSALLGGSVLFVKKAAGVWPARPTSRSDVLVVWQGPDPAPPVVSSGTGGMLDGVDVQWIAVS